jgi:hypothetical protein
MTISWRKEWFEYVKTIRKKESRKIKKECSHKMAMNLASQTWANYKLKLQRKLVRKEKQKKKTTIIEDKTKKNNVEVENRDLTI